MRLVQEDGRPVEIRHATAAVERALEILVREPLSGTVLLSLRLCYPDSCGQLSCMRPAVTTPGAGTDAPQSFPNHVVGSITAPPTDLAREVERWLTALGARGCTSRTIKDYRRCFARAVEETGWSSVHDATYLSITEWMSTYRASGDWSGATYNRWLGMFRSFTEWAHRAKILAEDPLVDAERAIDDGGPGSRAATTDEARRLIRHAWAKTISDKRAKGNRALNWQCLFVAACRLEEPGKWRREHLLLNEPIPMIHWTADINKNHRDQYIVLAPELVPLLRAHLAADDRARELRGLKPAGPSDPVFPVVPGKHTFPHDAEKVGIPHEDYRGRIFSPHSARKWFSTALTAEGVPEKMVDYLMRHAGRVEHRYYDPPLEDQAEAMSHLPRLWPDQAECPTRASGRIVDNSGGEPDRLTSGVQGGHDGSTTPGEPNRKNRLDSADQTRPHAAGVVFDSEPGLVSDLERQISTAQGKGPNASSSEPAELLNPTMGIQGLHLGAGSTHELANFLEALAKLIRSNGAGHEGCTFGGERSRA